MRHKFLLLGSVLLLSGTTLLVRPELLVVSSGGPSRPAVVRLDAQTGTILQRYAADQENVRGVAVDAAGEILVSGNSLGSGEIGRVGAPVATPVLSHPAFTMPGNLKIGPGGDIYVISAGVSHDGYRGQVLRFGSQSRALEGGFVGDESTGTTWTDLAFGPDGMLYVSDQTLGVMRFDPVTGEFLGVFVPGGPGGPRSASAIAFGPDGNLYVADRDDSSVLRFDGKTGQFMDNFIPSQTGGLKGPASLAFGSNHQLYVSSSENHSILRYDGRTGAFTGKVLSDNPNLQNPTRLVFASLP
jgi:DNA-binding beta-propeller fold protein YncE